MKTKSKKSLKQIVINTKAWTRGENCNNYGHCCAMGFLAKADLRRQGCTKLTQTEISDHADSGVGLSTSVISKIIGANDDLRGQERRETLRKLFRENGYRLIFK